MLVFRIFAHERKIFSTEGLLVRVKFRIILTNEGNCQAIEKGIANDYYEYE